jgi:asparagine synthase (glutamine-hydrolysing)
VLQARRLAASRLILFASMCGINGIFAYASTAPAIDRDELIRVRDQMRARGPDGAGAWFSDDFRIGLGHRRLAIIDLSETGAQPMASADGRYQVVFNGEIYNYLELREELEKRGRRFVSHSDTEVLLHLWELEGERMFPMLRGMFALAIWDSLRRRLLLARDPYGIKPLYYSDDGVSCRFASQVKALVASNALSRRFDPAGAAGFFLRGTVPEPFTMYQAIRMLPAGSFLFIGEDGPGQPVPFFSIAGTLRDAVDDDRPIPEAERQQIVHDALLESVRYHMVADVPVGAFLSAGIDSSAVVGLARESGASDLETLTLRFEEYSGRDNDEAPLAALVASFYGVRHTVHDLTLPEFKTALPRIFEAMDQPTVDGMNSYFVSQAAAAAGLKVAMSGSGGDELFGGYTSFRDIPRWMPVTSILSRLPRLGDAVDNLTKVAARRSRHVNPKMGEIIRYGSSYAGAYLVKRGRFLASELPELLGEEVAAEGLRRLDILGLIERAVTPDPGTPYARVMALESSLYLRNQLLRDMDWASMAHSLEVRVPLVDAHLLRKLAPVLVRRRGRGKGILAAAPQPPLPAAIQTRRKTGFTLPIREWLQKDQGGAGQPGKRVWARKVYEAMFSPENGSW